MAGAVESHDAYDSIRREVLRAIERRRLRPDRDLADVRAEVERAVDEYQRRAQFGEARRLADPATVVERVVRSIADLGPLTDLLARSDVEEIFIDGARGSRISTATAVCGASPNRRTRTRTGA